MTSIGEWAFFNCYNLQKCELPQNLKEIGENAFNCCAELETPVLPEHLAMLPERAFSFCNQITDITIPASVQQIGKEALWKCEGLKKITVLNPDCLIYDSGRTISNQTNGGYAGVIAGYGGSEAQFYAESLGYTMRRSLHAAISTATAPSARMMHSRPCRLMSIFLRAAATGSAGDKEPQPMSTAISRPTLRMHS